MTALNKVLSWFIKKRIHQIDLFRKYPAEVQQELFLKLAELGKDTEFGKKYGFSSVHSPEDFKHTIPVQHYEDVKPYVDRLMQGEQKLLWPSEIKWFAKSSGTTSSRSKFIPVSRESLEDCHYKGGKDLLSIYYNINPKAMLYKGKSLVIGGSSEVIDISEDSYFGDLSAIIIKNLPFWVEYRRTPDISVALMSEWEEKIQKMAEITSKEDVTNLAGVPSWALVLMERILEITGKQNIHDVWPNLELFMHGGVNFEPYKSRFQKLFPGDMSYLESYNASEGFFGIQDKKDKNELLLMLDYGIFYEFIPEEEFGKENPETISLGEVEIGKQYAPVISTNAGLWRYCPGDTVAFTSKYPFRIQVTGRTKSFINAFGEELIVDNADKAIAYACQETNATLTDYTAAPIFQTETESGAHEWVIEFKIPPTNVEQFTFLLDQKLKELNTDYEAKRTGNLTLNLPKIHVAPEGTFYHWLKQKNKLGGQNKVPRLHNNRKYLDEILPALQTGNVELSYNP